MLYPYFLFTAVCLGQSAQSADGWVKKAADARLRLRQIDGLLSSAEVSGSLIYQGFCGSATPEAPPVRAAQSTGPPTKVLQEMLADIPYMRVTQEPSGLVRMTATDVPTDLLDFKIHDMQFASPSDDNSINHGPNMAWIAVEMNSEVKAFRNARGIGPYGYGFTIPGNASSGPVVYGHLKDVTVSQALDYILQTFPGFWIYENCVDQEGERTVRVSFMPRMVRPTRQ